MSPDDFFRRQKEVREEVANMSPEEREAFLAAAQRHGRKVRSEILASAAVRQRERENPGTNEGFDTSIDVEYEGDRLDRCDSFALRDQYTVLMSVASRLRTAYRARRSDVSPALVERTMEKIRDLQRRVTSERIEGRERYDRQLELAWSDLRDHVEGGGGAE